MENFADTILMVRPTNFYTNDQTLEDNKYMTARFDSHVGDDEFYGFMQALSKNGINIFQFNQEEKDALDSLFVNNWFSTHGSNIVKDGLFILYPMKPPNRRLERNPNIIKFLKPKYANFIDLTYLENENEFLESTGSLIFDNQNCVVYCSISERATPKALEVFIEKFNSFTLKPWKLVTFRSYDIKGSLIYHSNCMMTVLNDFVLVCKESICLCNNKCEKKCFEDAQKLFELNSLNKKVLNLSYHEIENFCGNTLNLKNYKGESILALSKRAFDNLSEYNKNEIGQKIKFVFSSLDLIEKVGGGSARCLIGELF